jgi:hypothetical protein
MSRARREVRAPQRGRRHGREPDVFLPEVDVVLCHLRARTAVSACLSDKLIAHRNACRPARDARAPGSPRMLPK